MLKVALSALFTLTLYPAATQAAPVIKANTTDNLNLGSSWIGGIAPGAADIAIWDSTVTGPNSTSLGATITWSGLRILNPADTVSIHIGSNTLNITGAGIDMSSATANLIITGGANNLVTNPSGELAIDIAARRQLEILTRVEQSGRFLKSGEGSLILAGTGNNSGTQATVNAGTVILAKSSASHVHALGGGTHIAHAGGTIQLGGTGDNQIFSGASLNLDGGTLDMNGRNEGFDRLTGNGTVTNSAAATLSTLSLGLGGGNSTFLGNITDGAGSIALVKTGDGTLTLAGTGDNSGTQATVNAGTVILAKSSASHVHALGGGTHIAHAGGTIQLGGTGDNQIFSDASLNLNGGTLDMNGRNEGFDRLTGNGTVTNSAAATLSTLSLGLGGGNSTFLGNITDGAGSIALVKTGDGTLTLTRTNAFTGTNTFTGNTTISGGTLSLGTTGSIATSTSVTLGAGGTFETSGQASYAIPASQSLTFGLDTTSSGKITADGLDITDAAVTFTGATGASVYVLASYTSLTGTSFASVTGLPSGYTLDYAYESNKIALISSGASPYDTWASINAPTGTPADDFDGDGVSNAIEFVLGGDKDTNDLDKLPVVATTATDMTFSFVRDRDTVDPSVAVVIEVGTDLATWPSTYTVGADTAGSTAGVTVTDDNLDGTDTITLTVAQAPDGKKFARLKVTITP